MKLLFWNINGLRAISKKQVKPNVSFSKFISSYDIVVLNETKIDMQKLNEKSYFCEEYFCYHSCSKVKKGYSGVSILSKVKPIKRIDPPFDDDEGRIVALEYDDFILVGVYVPNSGMINKETKLPKRLHYRTQIWDKQFIDMCANLCRKKEVIVTGDFNVAKEDIDVYQAGRNERHAGFTVEEKKHFHKLLNQFIDVWRSRNPNKVEYTYFDYRSRARERNAGWRIDYVLATKSIEKKINHCKILKTIIGSDHLPIEVNLI